MWKMLLVPHDFSPCAARALRLAVELAKSHGSQLTLLHVSELPASLAPDTLVLPAGGTASVRVDDYTTRSARAQLEEIVRRGIVDTISPRHAARLLKRGISSRT